MEFNYFSVYVKHFPCPLTLNIKTKESDKIKIFASDTNEFPSSFNSDKKFENKLIKIMEKNQKKEFECNFYYFSIISDFTQEIEIIINFGEISHSKLKPNETRSHKKQVFTDITSIKTPQLIEQISFFFKKNN